MDHKIIFCLLVWLAAASASLWSDTRPHRYNQYQPIPFQAGAAGYAPGQEFVYTYQTQALTGHPGASSQFAGLILKAKLRLQTQERDQIIAQLENVRICHVNEVLKGLTPQEIIPDHFCIEDQAAATVELKKQLEQPFVFKFLSGYVMDLVVDEKEMIAAVNVKRGILQVLNTDMRKKNAVEVTPRPFQSAWMLQRSERSEVTPAMAWISREHDLVGECVSAYTAVHDRTAQKIYVTRARDYSSCTTRPIYSTGFFSGFAMTPKNAQNPIAMQTITDYVLHGDEQAFIIQEAVTKTQVHLEPLKPETGIMLPYTTFVIQHLALEAQHAPTIEIRKPHYAVQKPALHMEVVTPLVEPELHMKIAQHEVPLIIQKAHQMLESIIPHYERNMVTEETAKIVAEFTRIIRALPQAELVNFVKAIVTRDVPVDVPMKIKRELVMDLIATIDSPFVPAVVRELIKEGHITTPTAALIINVYAISAQPTVQAIQTLLEVAREQINHQAAVPVLKRACILSAGALTYKLHAMHAIHPIHEETIAPIRHKLHSEWEQLLTECHKVDDILAVVKALGNAGMYEFVPKLEVIAVTAIHPVKVRVEAVKALRRMPIAVRPMVHRIAMGLFMDTRVPAPIRVASFLITMETEPVFTTIQTIAFQINKEPSMEVASFVYSYLISRTMVADYPARQVELALRAVQPMPPTLMLHSKNIRIPLIQDIIKTFDIDMDVSFLNTEGQSFIPNIFIASLQGRNNLWIKDILTVGVDVSGINKIVRNVFNGVPVEVMLKKIMAGEVPLEEILRPFTQHGEFPAINKLWEKVNYAQQALPQVEFMAFIKIFGHELGYFDVNQANIQMIYEQAREIMPVMLRRLSEGLPINMLRSVSLPHSSIVIPSPVGIPVIYKQSSVSLIQLRGDITLHGLSYWSQLMSLVQRPTVTLKINLHANVVSRNVAHFGPVLGHLNAVVAHTVEAAVQWPLNAEVIIHGDSLQIKAAVKVPEHEMEVLKIKSVPFTAIIAYQGIQAPVVARKPMVLFGAEHVPMTFTMPMEALRHVLGAVPIITAEYLPPMFGAIIPAEFKAIVAIRPTAEVKYWTFKTALIVGEAEHVRDAVLAEGNTRVQMIQQIHAPAEFTRATKLQIVAAFNDIAKAQITYIIDSQLLKQKVNVQAVIAPITQIAAQPVVAEIDADIHIPAIMHMANMAEPLRIIVGRIMIMGEQLTDVHVLFNPRPVAHGHGLFNAMIYGEKNMPVGAMGPIAITAELNYNAAVIPEIFKNYILVANTVVIEQLQRFPWIQTVMGVEMNTPNRLIVTAIVEPVGKVITIVRVPGITEKFIITIHHAFKQLINMPHFHQAITPAYELAHIPAYGAGEVVAKPWYTKYITKLYHAATGYSNQAVCSVVGPRVQTLDLFTYVLPDINCEAFLIKDCVHKTFAVTIKKAMEHPEKKIIKVYLGDNVIEIVPVASGWFGSVAPLKVIINGQVKDVAAVPVIKNMMGEVVAMFEKTDAGLKIKSEKFGIVLETDLHMIKAKVADYLTESICGLCGSSGAHIKKADLVSRSIIPGPQCHPAEVRGAIEGITKAVTGECRTELRNRIIRRMIEGEQMICVSKEPVNVCTEMCHRVAPHHKVMGFFCAHPSSFEARTIEAEVPKRPVYDFVGAEYAVSFTERMSTQNHCAPIVH